MLVLALLAVLTLDDARRLQADGRLDEARAAYEEVLAAPDLSLGDEAIVSNNLCLLWSDLGDYQVAEAACLQALELRREISDLRGLARTLNNLGLVLRHQGRFEEARGRFEEALAINETRDDLPAQVVNLTNLGVVATERGDLARAFEAYATATDIARSHESEPWARGQLGWALANEGVVLERIGAHREALERFHEARDLPSDSATLRASLAVNTGVAYRNLGDAVTALEWISMGRDELVAIGDEAGAINALLNLGLVRQLNLEDPVGAEGVFRTALARSTAIGERPLELQSLVLLARLLFTGGRLEAAEPLFTKALRLAESSGSSEARWSALAGLGRIARRQGRLVAARERFERAIGQIEAVRQELDLGRSADLYGSTRSVYGDLVDTLAELELLRADAGYGAEALALVERAKLGELEENLGRTLPSAEVPSVPSRAAWLEYFLGTEHLWVWIRRSDRVETIDLGPVAGLTELTSAVQTALASGRTPDSRLLGELADQLLRPLLPRLVGVDELVVAADAGFRYLPFELLPLGVGELVLDRFVVSYLPSGALPSSVRGEPASRKRILLGFGASRAPTTNATATLLTSRLTLEPLPGVERELSIAGKAIDPHATIFLDEDASEATLLRELVEGARVVHLATHAVLDERLDRGAALLLRGGDGEDGVVHPTEIAAGTTRADLVVLAACRTAQGRSDRALASLTGAFLLAGAHGVLATLWEVGDEASVAFMEQFYYELGQGRSPADALHRVKLRLRADERWSSPALWAPYVLVGRSPPVGPRRLGWPLAALGVGAIGLLLFLLPRLRR